MYQEQNNKFAKKNAAVNLFVQKSILHMKLQSFPAFGMRSWNCLHPNWLKLMKRTFKRKIHKNVWCVACRHVENLDKKIFKKLTLAKILCWTFQQLLLPSSAKDKNANVLTAS